jgi:hypothetical protein
VAKLASSDDADEECAGERPGPRSSTSSSKSYSDAAACEAMARGECGLQRLLSHARCRASKRAPSPAAWEQCCCSSFPRKQFRSRSKRDHRSSRGKDSRSCGEACSLSLQEPPAEASKGDRSVEGQRQQRRPAYQSAVHLCVVVRAARGTSYCSSLSQALLPSLSWYQISRRCCSRLELTHPGSRIASYRAHTQPRA